MTGCCHLAALIVCCEGVSESGNQKAALSKSEGCFVLELAECIDYQEVIAGKLKICVCLIRLNDFSCCP